MEETTKECRKSVPWDLRYADNLVLTAETRYAYSFDNLHMHIFISIYVFEFAREEMQQQFFEWKAAIENSSVKVNTGNTKLLVSGKEPDSVVCTGKYPCGVCHRGVGVNYVLCTECNRWIY